MGSKGGLRSNPPPSDIKGVGSKGGLRSNPPPSDIKGVGATMEDIILLDDAAPIIDLSPNVDGVDPTYKEQGAGAIVPTLDSAIMGWGTLFEPISAHTLKGASAFQ